MSGDIGCSRRQAFGAAALLGVSLLANERMHAAEVSGRSGTAPIDGIGVYYEVHGPPLDGRVVPLVLLHGGALTIETAFSTELIARFARHRPVIAIEQQGHGHTPDRPGAPITVDQMVKDTAGVLNHLKVRQADLFGHSLGGIVATGVAIYHPGLVRNVTILGTPYRLQGFRADLVRLQTDPAFTPSSELAELLPTDADFARWRASYRRSAPDPLAYDRILERLNVMLATWRGWSDEETRRIRSSMLIVIGDNDYVRIEHAAQMARLVANARLAVMPGTTHLGIAQRFAWIEPMMDALARPSL